MDQFDIYKDNSIKMYSNTAKMQMETQANQNNYISQEYGLLPTGVKTIRHISTGYSNNMRIYVLYETRPQRREIVFRNDWKNSLEDIEPSEQDYYSLPFPWMQFHMTIPVFQDENDRGDIDVRCSLTVEEFDNLDQNVLPFHLPNMIYPSNKVCIYGNALGINKSEYAYIDAKDILSYDLGPLISTIAGSIFESGWNMNVSDWPQVVPEEFGLQKIEHNYEEEHPSYEEFYRVYDPMETILRWQSMSVSDVLRLKPMRIKMSEFLEGDMYEGTLLGEKPSIQTVFNDLTKTYR